MAALNPPLYLQAGTYPASLDSTAIAAAVAADPGADQTTRSGVIFNHLGSLRVTASNATSVSVASGRAVVDNGQGGAYLCTNRGSSSVSIPATSASPRRDIIGVRVLDAANGDVGDNWVLLRVQGAAASSPSDPALPSFFTPLARIRIPASTSNISSAMVDDLRVFTAAPGGVIVCTSTTRPSTSNTPYGLMIFETDTLQMLVFDGTAWRQMARDTVTATSASNVGFTVKGFTGQSANLQEWRSSTNTLLASMSATGTLTAAGLTTAGAVSAASVAATGNVTGANLGASGNVTGSSIVGTGAVGVIDGVRCEILAGYGGGGGLSIAQAGSGPPHPNGVVLWVSGNTLYALKPDGSNVTVA